MFVQSDTGRKISLSSGFTSSYWFGFNGQEKDDEVYGTGNAYTATFWEYDPRVGRRWNLDPKTQISFSDYSCFGDNPIINVDPRGDYFFGLFGSTKAQREAATQLAVAKGGTVVNIHSKSICVSYTNQIGTDQRTGEAIMGITDQYFNKDGSYVPTNGEIKVNDNSLVRAELWLDSPSKSVGEAGAKILSNILYSLPNSASILLSGSTIAGSDAKEKMTDAFVDVAPSIVGLIEAGTSVRVTKAGLEGFNQFLKKSPGLLKGRGRDVMMKEAGRLFQMNKDIRNAKEALNSVNELKEVGEKTDKEIKK